MPGLAPGKLNRVDGKVAGVLFAAEAFLLGCGDQFAVDDQRRRGIHALRDSVFALFQAGPLGLLKGHGVFQPADSNDLHLRPFRHKRPVSTEIFLNHSVMTRAAIEWGTHPRD